MKQSFSPCGNANRMGGARKDMIEDPYEFSEILVCSWAARIAFRAFSRRIAQGSRQGMSDLLSLESISNPSIVQSRRFKHDCAEQVE